LPEVTSSIASATWFTEIFLALLASLTWTRANSVKVPTGPRNAKVRLTAEFEFLEGIDTRLGPKIEVRLKKSLFDRALLVC
jgi:hypothetical protein